MNRRFARSYVLLVGVPLVLLIGLLAVGQQRYADQPISAVARSGGNSSFQVLTLILQITVILVVARLAGALFRRIGQPQVVGEMAAGLLLGPSVFGALAPRLSQYVFPPASLGYLNALSQVGLLLFMFMIGLEMDARLLRDKKRVALLTSHASIVLPFLFGVLLAFEFFNSLGGAGSFTGFALFMGIAMSITAFPVLARILQERQLTETHLGTIALASAAIGDVTAWCILAFVVMIARSGEVNSSLWVTLGGSAVFVAVMLLVARPLLRSIVEKKLDRERISQNSIALLLIFALASAWMTERLGIHALFGAFLAGAILPAHYPFVQDVIRKLEDLTVVFLLPLFFAFTGLRMHFDWAGGTHMWATTFLIIAVAVAGKFGGSAIGARASGMTWREAGALGALMNTRGLMELVVLNIGLDIGVIPPQLFAMMVVMALVTTVMTTPLLRLFEPG